MLDAACAIRLFCALGTGPAQKTHQKWSWIFPKFDQNATLLESRPVRWNRTVRWNKSISFAPASALLASQTTVIGKDLTSDQ